MSEPVIEIQGASKKFCRDFRRSLWYGAHDLARTLAGCDSDGSLRRGEFWALRDFTCRIARGEAFGLVGRNGSGKTTLLRLISGLLRPDAGRIRVSGRLTPLIALGAGFSSLLTGRENVRVNMAMLGVPGPQIERRLGEVIEFAELSEEVMDAPFQTFSSGMQARLCFASAVFTDPEILLIDEVLSVGDLPFKHKCLRHMNRLREGGTAFIFVSHSSEMMKTVCDRAAYLREGTTEMIGPASDVVAEYEKEILGGHAGSGNGFMKFPQKEAAKSAGADITHVCFRDERGERMERAPVTGESCFVCVGCHVRRPLEKLNAHVWFAENKLDEPLVLSLLSAHDQRMFDVGPGHYELRLYFPSMGLKPGDYLLGAYVREKELHMLDHVKSVNISVQSNGGLFGKNLFYQPRQWRLVQTQAPSKDARMDGAPSITSPCAAASGNDGCVL